MTWLRSGQIGDLGGHMLVHFATAPQERSLASLSLSGHAFEGMLGHVSFTASWAQPELYVPIDLNFAARTVDFAFVPPVAPQPCEILMAVTRE